MVMLPQETVPPFAADPQPIPAALLLVALMVPPKMTMSPQEMTSALELLPLLPIPPPLPFPEALLPRFLRPPRRRIRCFR